MKVRHVELTEEQLRLCFLLAERESFRLTGIIKIAEQAGEEGRLEYLMLRKQAFANLRAALWTYFAPTPHADRLINGQQS